MREQESKKEEERKRVLEQKKQEELKEQEIKREEERKRLLEQKMQEELREQESKREEERRRLLEQKKEEERRRRAERESFEKLCVSSMFSFARPPLQEWECDKKFSFKQASLPSGPFTFHLHERRKKLKTSEDLKVLIEKSMRDLETTIDVLDQGVSHSPPQIKHEEKSNIDSKPNLPPSTFYSTRKDKKPPSEIFF